MTSRPTWTPVESVASDVSGGNQPAFVVVGVELPGQHQSAQIVHAGNAVRLGFGFAERGQEHAGQDGDDGNHHQQFDESEPGCPVNIGGWDYFHDVKNILVSSE